MINPSVKAIKALENHLPQKQLYFRCILGDDDTPRLNASYKKSAKAVYTKAYKEVPKLKSRV